jgi:hypothetical protein
LFQLAIIGKNKKLDPASFPVLGRVTRSVTQSRNNLVSEPGSTPMADPRVDRLEKQIANIQTMLEGLLKQTADNSKTLAENSNGRTRDKHHQGFNNSTAPKLAKLDFPRYNGVEDPTSWICRVEQFFEFQRTEETEKLAMAAYHLEGEAQMWYQLFRESEEALTWKSLKKGLHVRYGPTVFEDHFGDLTKLQQTGSTRDYQLQFEQLLSRVGKLSNQHQGGV